MKNDRLCDTRVVHDWNMCALSSVCTASRTVHARYTRCMRSACTVTVFFCINLELACEEKRSIEAEFVDGMRGESNSNKVQGKETQSHATGRGIGCQRTTRGEQELVALLHEKKLLEDGRRTSFS